MSRPRPVSSGEEALSAVEMLALEQIGDSCFRSSRNQDNRTGTIFGGQPLAQALAAAHRTVAAGWPAHSLSASFMRGGDCNQPVDYQVELLRDGRRYASRRVLASQAGKAIFDCLVAFHDAEEGGSHQCGGITGVPMPETLPSMAQLAHQQGDRLPPTLKRSFTLPFPVEIRMVNQPGHHVPGEVASRDLWFRVASAADLDDPRDHQSMLAFASDYWLGGAAAIPHAGGGRRGFAVASLNHSMWFHAPVRADEWLLYRTSSPWSGHGRGLAQGQIFDRTGLLIATSAQEISLRSITHD